MGGGGVKACSAVEILGYDTVFKYFKYEPIYSQRDVIIAFKFKTIIKINEYRGKR